MVLASPAVATRTPTARSPARCSARGTARDGSRSGGWSRWRPHPSSPAWASSSTGSS